MSSIDDEIIKEFNGHIERCMTILQGTVWVDSYLSAANAFAAIVAMEIPECFQWELVPRASSSVPCVIITGYLPPIDQILRKKPKEPKKAGVH